MGCFLLRLFPWVTVLATLGCAAALEGDTNYRQDVEVALDAQELCPCIAYADCRREFGVWAIDPPCEIKGTVRCCGVTSSVSVQHSVSEGLPSGSVYPVPVKLPGYLEHGSRAGSLRHGSGVQEGGATSQNGEYYLEEEFSDEGSEADRRADDDERGKNIDSGISQVGASPGPDFLDYRGVSKLYYPATVEEEEEEEDEDDGDDGERTTSAADHARGQRRGKISSSERSSLTLTSTSSSSSSVGNIERVLMSRKETAERLTGVRGKNLVELSRADERQTPGSLDGTGIIEPVELTASKTKGPGVIPATLTAATTAAEEIGARNQEAEVAASGKKSSATDERRDILDENSYEAYDYLNRNYQLGTRGGVETTLKNHRETSSLAVQQESGKAAGESSSDFEESNSSTITGDEQQQRNRLWNRRILGGHVIQTVKIPQAKIGSQLNDESVHDKLAEMSRQQRTEFETKGSSDTEESSSSSSKSLVTNTRDSTDKTTTSKMFSTGSGVFSEIRIPTTFKIPTLIPKVSIAYEENRETSSQQSGQSVEKESLKVEENASFNSRRTVTTPGETSDDIVSSGTIEWSSLPSLSKRPSLGVKGNTVYVQREGTSSQQSNESSKIESSNVEKSTSNSQSVATNFEGAIDANVNSEDADVKSGQVSTFRRPLLSRRPSLGVKGNTVHVQREETFSQQSSDTSGTEPSKVQEMTSNSQSVATNFEGAIDANVNSEDSDVKLGQVSTFRRPSLSRRPSLGLRGDTAYVQREEITSQQSSDSLKTESSKVEENTSSNSQTVTKNLGDLSEKDEKSGDFDTGLKPLAETPRPIPSRTFSLSMRGDMVYSELKETSSQQKIDSVKKEFSQAEKIKSSNVKSGTTNTEDPTTDRSNLELEDVTIMKHSDVKTAKEIVLNSKSESSSLKERENFAKSSGMSTTSTGSNLINVITRKPEITITGKPVSWQIAHQTYYPVLVNAGFLKDRPISTGPVGLDPLSGVTHSDLGDPDLITDLLPLSCGNVIFGERSMGGKMLLCDFPSPDDKPFQFLKGDPSTVSPEKLNGPELPGAFLPGTGLNAKDDEIPSKVLDAEKNISEKPVRRRIIVKRPNVAHRTLVANEDIREVGSKHVATESVLASSSTVKTASSLEESTFSPSSVKGITKSRFDASSAKNFNAEGAIGALNSKFYSLNRVPSRPRPVTPDSSATAEEKPADIVEIVNSAPSTEIKVNRKRLRVSSSDDKLPRNDLEVLSIKTSEDEGANVEEERFVRPAETTGRRKFSFNRHSGRVQRATISPDDISMSGRINVIGPIPRGYIDPALITEDKVDIELPRERSITFFRVLDTEKQQGAADRGLADFRPSPVDPINWP